MSEMTDSRHKLSGSFLNAVTAGSAYRLLSSYLAVLAVAQIGTIGISLTPVAITQPIAILIVVLSVGAGFVVWRKGAAGRKIIQAGMMSPAPRWARLSIFCLCAFFGVLVLVSLLQPDHIIRALPDDRQGNTFGTEFDAKPTLTRFADPQSNVGPLVNFPVGCGVTVR